MATEMKWSGPRITDGDVGEWLWLAVDTYTEAEALSVAQEDDERAVAWPREWLRLRPIDQDDEDEVEIAEEWGCSHFTDTAAPGQHGAREFWTFNLTGEKPRAGEGDDAHA